MTKPKFINPDGDWQTVASKQSRSALGVNMSSFIAALDNVLEKPLLDALNHAAKELEAGKGRFPGDDHASMFLGVTDILAIVVGSLFTSTLARMIEAGAPKDAVKRARTIFAKYAQEKTLIYALKGKIIVKRKVH